MNIQSPSSEGSALDCLATCRWFEGVPTEALVRLATQAQWRSYQSDEYIFRTGEMPAGVFGVHEGSLKIVNGNQDGFDAVTTVITAGMWFGELPLCAGQAYIADCRALQACRLLLVPRLQLFALCEQIPLVYRNLLADVSRKALSISAMSMHHKLSSPEVRVAQRLYLALQQNSSFVVDQCLEWVELRERLSHELIAQMLGLSRPRVSQAMKTLEHAGILIAQRGRIRLHMERLKNYCH